MQSNLKAVSKVLQLRIFNALKLLLVPTECFIPPPNAFLSRITQQKKDNTTLSLWILPTNYQINQSKNYLRLLQPVICLHLAEYLPLSARAKVHHLLGQ